MEELNPKEPAERLEPMQPVETVAQHHNRFLNHLLIVLLGLFAIWTVKMVEVVGDLNFAPFGLFPRRLEGLPGVVTMPFIHKDFDHLINNSAPLFLQGLLLLSLYRHAALRVTVYTVFGGGLLVWLLARPSYHIGASGLVYGLSGFLFFSGLVRRERRSVGGALVVAFLYGGAVWGVLPLWVDVSWEGHLFGALIGAILAIIYRKVDLPPPKPESKEEREPDDDLNALWRQGPPEWER